MQPPILSNNASDSPPSEVRAFPQSMHSNEELGMALEHGLELPLSALRASMEYLQHRMPEGTQNKRALHVAIQKVELICRNVHDLMELAVTPSPMPLRCTPLEIASSARSSLPAVKRTRVLFADMTAGTSVHMDAPLVIACLKRLITNACEASSGFVLLSMRSLEGSTTFTIVDGAAANFDEDWALTAFHSNKRHHMGLGLALVERDMELLGGNFNICHTGNGETMACLTVPNQHKSRPAQDTGAAA
jgi:K+-sensing histidine kinase KdpD